MWFLPSSSSSFEAPLSCPLRSALDEDVEKFGADEIFKKFDRWNKFLQARNSDLLSTKFFCCWWHNLENDRDKIRWHTGRGIRIRNIFSELFCNFVMICFDVYINRKCYQIWLLFLLKKFSKNVLCKRHPSISLK